MPTTPLHQKLKLLYEGSVKNLLKDESHPGDDSIWFEYTDAFSVFDWGRMPDALSRKGEALAVMAADFFSKLEDPSSWRELIASPTGQALLRANRFGAGFEAVGKKLSAEGLRTHFLNLGPAESETSSSRHLRVRQVSARRPETAKILGREVFDYSETRVTPAPRLAPLEVVFRFGMPPGSSLAERLKRDPEYLSSRGFPEGHSWDFPVLELFTKLESSDRPLTLSEALALSGLRAPELEGLLFRTAWVAALLRHLFGKQDLELADGKLEWAVGAANELILVDAIGPDELRVLSRGAKPVQLSKEFLRGFYRGTDWYRDVSKAKQKADAEGLTDWKSLVKQAPPALPAQYKELGSQVYLALANELTGKRWFAEAWDLRRVVQGLSEIAENQKQGSA